jgi:AhpD family alkylhydroperoxidase
MAGLVSNTAPDTPTSQGALARMLADQPEALRALIRLEAALAGPSRVPGWLKELVLTRVAALNGCTPCIRLHLSRARRNGLSSGLAAASVGDVLAPSAELRAALALAEALTAADATVPDRMAEAGRHYGAEEVGELVLLIAAANMFNRLVAVARTGQR